MDLSCANCQHALPEDAKFCPNCGQSTKSLRQPFFPFVRDSVHELLDIDGRLWLTLKTLLLKPGLAAYEFDQGKRDKYSPPLRLYLVISLLFFLLFSSFHHLFVNDAAQSESVTNLYSKAMFVLFPIFAFYVKCFFRNSYYLSNLVFSMHIHSTVYIVLAFTIPLESMEKQGLAFQVLQLPPFLYLVWYFARAFKTMYRQSWPETIAKFVAIYLLYMASLGVVFDIVLAK